MSDKHVPEERMYTADHEWVDAAPGSEPVGRTLRVGITSFAADALGDVVYLELPEVGATIVAGQACGEVESTKSVSDLIPPVSGTVTALNAAAEANPSLINTDPFGDGWLFMVEVTATGAFMTAGEYAREFPLTD